MSDTIFALSSGAPPAAIGVVRSRNVVHAALYLVVVLAGGAAQFILLGQEGRFKYPCFFIHRCLFISDAGK